MLGSRNQAFASIKIEKPEPDLTECATESHERRTRRQSTARATVVSNQQHRMGYARA